MNSRSFKFILYLLFGCLLYCAIIMTIILFNNNQDNSTPFSIQKAYKSVVGIHVVQNKVSKKMTYNPWQKFWDNYPGKEVIENMGSGLILSSDGYIVTNYHVIENASKIFVKLHNGESYDIDLKNVYVDKLTDIALIKIFPNNDLSVPVIGNSNNIIAGQDVIALGNPLGLFNASNQLTATKGIISALNVDFGFNDSSGNVYQDMIQTDASINPGNSGGPLLNLKGEIIGLNTFVVTGSDNQSGSIGLNFAIPINRVIDIYNDLKNKGKVDRQFNTGIKVKEINQIIAQYLRLESTDGILVIDVEKKSSGEKAGIKIGDVILKVNNKEVSTLDDIKRIINENLLKTGDKIELKILRNNYEYSLNLLLEKGGF